VDKKNFTITKQNAAGYTKKIAKFIKDYVTGAKKDGVVMGLSGGLDSSVVARLVQEAGIPLTVVVILDKDELFASGGLEHARELITKFKLDFKVLSIKNACEQLELGAGEALCDASRYGLRPRIRMSLLYALATNSNRLVAGTTNFDETVIGYYTKWGDGASDFNPLGMLTKGEIKILAAQLGVPQAIIDKAPSADEFVGQTDEKEFGFTYDQLDKFVLKGTSGDKKADAAIKERAKLSLHKKSDIPVFNEKKQA